MATLEFPKFIQNKAIGQDSFEGKSAEKVASAIESHIKNVSGEPGGNRKQLPQIIGLEGAWGSGKSNVIRILKSKLQNEFFLFEYDAWGNQEDLQRRSFLEQLTKELIEEKILNGKTNLTSKGGVKKEVEWDEKLKYLLARKTETISEKYPRISNGMAVAGLVAVLTPIFVFIGYIIKSNNLGESWASFVSILIAFLPILISLGVWIKACQKDENYKSLSYLLAIYTDKIENDIEYETVSDTEPSVSQFKDWMSDISSFIQINGKKKLILVFDNMDRLPSEKVRELWSSIHTFFSEDGNENIWVIVPFDKKHLSNAFGEFEKNSSELTSEFISKTFPIIYKVPPAILTDRKGIFNKFFDEAFGHELDFERDSIQRIFSLLKTNYTPRDIIAFINEMVSLKLTWHDDVPLIPIAIFILRKEEIVEGNIDEYILSNKHIQNIEKIVDGDDELQRFMAALTYGIEAKMAEQIPLKQYLREALKGSEGYDVNKFIENRHFVTILEEELKLVDSQLIEKAIFCIDGLQSGLNDSTLWDYLAKEFLKLKVNSLYFGKAETALLIHSSEKNRHSIVSHLCDGFANIQEFKGDLYFEAVNAMDVCLRENNLGVDLVKHLKILKANPETFIAYVSSAKEEFERFEIFCSASELDEYLAGKVPSLLPDPDFLVYLVKNDNYAFSRLTARIESSIADDTFKHDDFSAMIDSYKFISKSKPLKQKFSPTQISSLIAGFTDTKSPGYLDSVAMAVATGSLDFVDTDKIEDGVAERIEYYITYGELLKLVLSWNSPFARKLALNLTQHKRGISKLLIKEILPLFYSIKEAIKVEELTFLNRLNGWSSQAETEINATNIQEIIPNHSFFQSSCLVKNDLTAHINNTAIKGIASIPPLDLFANRNNVDDYWLNSIANLIKGKVLLDYPENLTEFCRTFLKAIPKGEPLPPTGSLIDIIIRNANVNKLQPTVTSIAEDFCNRAPVITPEQFLYFETNFDFLGKLSNRDGEITRNIIGTVLTNSEASRHVVENPSRFSKIINNAGDDAEEVKALIKQHLEREPREALHNFAIGINAIQRQ